MHDLTSSGLLSFLHLRNLLHRKLLLRLTIPSIIAAAMLVGVIIDTLFFTPIPAITFAWILVGIIIGYPFGCLIRISWNSDRTQLVLVGSSVTVLGVYVVTRIITDIIIHIEYGYLSLRVSYSVAYRSWISH